MVTAVILKDEHNRNMCAISLSWILLDESQVLIPSVPSGKLHGLVRNHTSVSEETAMPPVPVLVRLVRLLNIKRSTKLVHENVWGFRSRTRSISSRLLEGQLQCGIFQNARV